MKLKLSKKTVLLSTIVIILIFLVYSLSLKNDLLIKAGNIDYLNYWDLALSFLSDSYLFIYFIFPLFLFISVYHIEENFHYAFIIRHKKYNRWILAVIKKLEIYSHIYFLIIGITLLLIFLLVNNSFSNEWSFYTSNLASNYPSVEVLPTLFETRLSPISTLILQIAYIMIFFILIFILLCAVFIVSQKKNTLIITSILIFFYAAVSFHLLPNDLSFLSLASYALVYHGFVSFGSVWKPLFVMVILMLVILGSVSYLRQYSLLVVKVKDYLPHIIYILLVTLGLLVNSLEYDHFGKTLGEFIFLKFYGINANGYSLLQLIYYSIVFFGFCYLYQITVDDLIKRNLHYELIRYKSYKRWFLKHLKRLVQSILLFIFSFFIVTILIGIMKGYQFSFEVFIDGIKLGNWEVTYHFLINSFLQLTNYCLILFIVSWFFKEAYYGLIVLTLMMIWMMLPLNIKYILPIGWNGYGVLVDTNVYFISSLLIIYLILEYIGIQILFKETNNM